MDIVSVFGIVLFSAAVDTIKDLVVKAVSDGADLSGAALSCANMRGANLYGANLYGAALSDADLRGADLRGANLSGAALSDANLSGADLRGADLSGANLSDADLRGADLRGADLRSAKLPPPTAVLLAAWSDVSKQLCADLMEYDCWNHGSRKAFDNYAITKKCPFDGNGEQRAANFQESGEIWAKKIGKLCSPRDLMLRLFAEKNIKR